ncbi:MAG TPA: DUF255 domain-containing protein [Armatimonadota bacterium]|nr:DUF255 domain-containing protein [Armatimonadota bacterium]
MKSISTYAKVTAALIVGFVFVALGIVSQASQPGPTNTISATGNYLYTNALIHSSSPYLLEHAHNPVNWYPWGPEALDLARKQKKPIFLSIGYSACHWCHVMMREDFENPVIARILNAHFVCIKVDREQRPDLDAQYQSAVEMLSGSGGWPLSVFLMPDLKPFYGGTYFPPDQFKSLLLKVVDVYQKQPVALQRQADRGAAAVTEASAPAAGGKIATRAIQQAAADLSARYDAVNGGFGLAPKFPEAPNLQFLLDRYQSTHDPALLKMLTHTLDEMAAGGIYDQLSGGFHRYSTDDHWRVPHFEKMLYDQALLIPIYLDVWKITRRPIYRRVAVETLNFVETAFRLPGGGFASSFDADSEGVEGKYYLWTPAQVKAVLGPAASRFDERYGVTAAGDLDGKSVLHQNPALITASNSDDPPATSALQPAGSQDSADRRKMLAARDRRTAPARDDKALAGWNGLTIAAFARGYQVLGDRKYLNDALHAARFVDTKLMVKGHLMRSFYAGSASIPAQLDDEAFLIHGFLALYDATHDRQWLDRSTVLAQDMIHRFDDPVRGGFYTTASQGDLLARRKEADDNALPSGNGVAAEDLARLADLTHNPAWREAAVKTAQAFQPLIRRAPDDFPTLLTAYAAASGGQSLAPAAVLTLAAKPERAAVKPGETLTISLVGSVANGWHVNAHEPGDKTLIPTTVNLAKTPIAQLVRVSYPAAERLKIPGGGDTVLAYRGHFVIPAVVRIAAGAPPGPSPLRFNLTYQPCSDRECLAPAEATARITAQVASKP